jgi:hypothetical protein
MSTHENHASVHGSPREGGGTWRRRLPIVLAATTFMVALFSAPAGHAVGAEASAPPVVAAVTGFDTAASGGQRFVPSVLGAFNGLSTRADALGFHRRNTVVPTLCRHYQGFARKDGPDGTPYMFLTRSGNIPSSLCFGEPIGDTGHLVVVRMGSRDKTGERMRANLHPYNQDDIPAEDEAIVDIPLIGTNGWPAYEHPGGMQILGDVLVIGTENPWISGHETAKATLIFVDISNPEDPQYLTRFDLPNLGDEFGADPVGLTAIKAPNGACCRYLLIVAGGPGNREVGFYRSKPDNPLVQTTTLKSKNLGWDEVGRFTESQIESCLGADWPSGERVQHQMLNFVREGNLDGKLFVVGGVREGSVGNPLADEDEYLDLYEAHLTSEGVPASCPLTFVRRKQVGLDGIGPALQAWGDFKDNGSFAAGSSVYVSPTGEMVTYVSDHRTTLFGQYRLRSLVRAGSPTLRPTASVDGPFAVDEGSSTQLTGQGKAPITKAFVQLFEDTGAGVPHDDSAWLNVEFEDRNLDHFDHLCRLDLDNNLVFDPCGDVDPDPLADRVSSVRWFAPPGCDIQLNDYPVSSDEFPGPSTALLRGTGQFQEVHDLSKLQVSRPPEGTLPPWPVSPPVPGQTGEEYDYDDDIEGVTFYKAYRVDGTLVRDHRGCESYYNAAYTLGWDLDNNGSFESSGTSVPFGAAQLDGPTTATVQARGAHPTDTSTVGTGVPVPVSVSVRNVAPAIASASVKDALGYDLDGGGNAAIVGLPVKLAVTFTDPGLADTQSAVVDWGDGTPLDTSFGVFSDARNGAVGALQDAHAFSAPGTYTIRATITDDDGGATTKEFTVTVLSLEDAIERVADRLTELIAATTDAGVAAALRAARDELIGNHAGTPPTNGAVDKLEADDPVGAITKLKAAMSDIVTAESSGAGDLSALKDLLGLVAEGIATAEYHEAQAAVSPPSPGQARALATIADAIAQGHQQLVDHAYLKACDDFRQATEKALQLQR